MRSKVHVRSHPIHPILVAFPIVFFTGTWLFDGTAYLTGNLIFYTLAYYLNIAGIIVSVAAAVPGILDFIYIVPPESSAKKRAAKHGLINTAVLILFSVSLVLKHNDGIEPEIILVMELVAFILLGIAGWLGGTLVFRNQIGVDHRYAAAGKWKESHFKSSGNKIEVCSLNELEQNQMKLLHINGRRIVLGRTEDGYVAFEDRCSHRGGSLVDGSMICGTVQCPWHGSQFDTTTGHVRSGPAKKKIGTYQTVTEGSRVYLIIP